MVSGSVSAQAPATGASCDDGLSKSARKRLTRHALRQASNEAKKRRKKAEHAAGAPGRAAARAQRAEAAFDGMTAGERVVAEAAKRERTLAARTNERAERERVRRAMEEGGRVRVCIDLAWGGAMVDKEMRSLVKQVAYSYSAVKKRVEAGGEAVGLSVAGVGEDVGVLLDRHASGWRDWPVRMSAEGLVETHAKEDIVYLTHDADDVLEELDDGKVYVIGGIVDRNRLKGATLTKAQELGVKTARLNLDTSVSIGSGTAILTVNHCVEILLAAANGASWQDAYIRVLPGRKQLEVKKEAGNTAEASAAGIPDAVSIK